jgi:hypothetical protein
MAMQNIWHNFYAKREINRSGAYRQLLADLTKYADVLVPYVIGLKDFVALCMNIEEYLKGNAGEQGRSPLEEVRRFLTGDDAQEPNSEVVN